MCTIDGDLLKTLENSGFMIATRRGLRSFRFRVYLLHVLSENKNLAKTNAPLAQLVRAADS